jgi:Ni,Fe-hydrogenase III component G
LSTDLVGTGLLAKSGGSVDIALSGMTFREQAGSHGLRPESKLQSRRNLLLPEAWEPDLSAIWRAAAAKPVHTVGLISNR